VHSGNGKVERSIGVLKTLARVMQEDPNLHASYWFFAIRHTFGLANMIFLVEVAEGPRAKAVIIGSTV